MIKYHTDLIQGSAEWLAARCGMLTASEMRLILTPTLKIASNDKERAHLYELLAQRVTGYVEPHFQTFDMERGHFEEEHARKKYSETYAPVTECGFITNDRLGFPIGYSPDGLVGDDGLIECKSRIQKWQMQTIIECVPGQTVPAEYMLQVQTAMFVSERQWVDYISYSGGMRMAVIRCYPVPEAQEAIVQAAAAFEQRITEKLELYNNLIASDARLVETERLIYL